MDLATMVGKILRHLNKRRGLCLPYDVIKMFISKIIIIIIILSEYQVYLALRYTNRGHCKIEISTKCGTFLRRGKSGVPGGKPENPGENFSEQKREPTNSTHKGRRV